MGFFDRQDDARRRTRRLLLAFTVTVALLVCAVNLGLALLWIAVPVLAGGRLWDLLWNWPYPAYFFTANTAVTLLQVLGGWWIESSNIQAAGEDLARRARLRALPPGLALCGEALARRAGAREARPGGSDEEQRLCNVVDELAIAADMKPPFVMVVPRAESINGFAAGWSQEDAIIAVTNGALQRLTREELQGLVAHELSHLREGDTRLNMHLAGMVAGLQMLYHFGQWMCDLRFEREDDGRINFRGPLLIVPGLAFMALGWAAWLAGAALSAAVSRQREFLADARAVQWTRSREGIGGTLRKIWGRQQQARPVMDWDNAVLHMLLADESETPRWLDAHPPLAQRIRRIYGREMQPIAQPEFIDRGPAVFD